MATSKSFVDVDKASGEAGVTAAEYAIGAVTVTGVVGVMWWLVNQDWFRDGMKALLSKIFSVPGVWYDDRAERTLCPITSRPSQNSGDINCHETPCSRVYKEIQSGRRLVKR